MNLLRALRALEPFVDHVHNVLNPALFLLGLELIPPGDKQSANQSGSALAHLTILLHVPAPEGEGDCVAVDNDADLAIFEGGIGMPDHQHRQLLGEQARAALDLVHGDDGREAALPDFILQFTLDAAEQSGALSVADADALICGRKVYAMGIDLLSVIVYY